VSSIHRKAPSPERGEWRRRWVGEGKGKKAREVTSVLQRELLLCQKGVFLPPLGGGRFKDGAGSQVLCHLVRKEARTLWEGGES